MVTVQEALGRIGLTTNEIKVYLALLDLGSSLAGDVAKRANLHRRPTYDALNRLVEKGLVSYTIKAGKKSFHPADPERILGLVEEREKEIKEILPEIKEKFRAVKVKIFSEIYEGKEGLKTIMENMLQERKEWLTIGTTGKAPKILPFYLEQFAKRRVGLGIKRKTLLADTKEGREYYKILKMQGLIEVKFLPKEVKHPQTIWVWGDKVMIMLVSEEHPVMFLIDNKKIADSYREYFNLLWK